MPGLRDPGEEGAVRERAHQFIEDMHDLGSRALQLLDDVHARDETLLLRLEVVDLLDLFVEGGNLGFQPLVALLLARDHRAEQHVDHAGGEQRCDGAAAESREKRHLAFFALLGAPWEQVYLWHVSRSSAAQVRKP